MAAGITERRWPLDLGLARDFTLTQLSPQSPDAGQIILINAIEEPDHVSSS
jgi:hypothetical protein